MCRRQVCIDRFRRSNDAIASAGADTQIHRLGCTQKMPNNFFFSSPIFGAPEPRPRFIFAISCWESAPESRHICASVEMPFFLALSASSSPPFLPPPQLSATPKMPMSVPAKGRGGRRVEWSPRHRRALELKKGAGPHRPGCRPCPWPSPCRSWPCRR